MTYATAHIQQTVFPWSISETDRRFQRIARWVLAFFLVAGLVIGLLPEIEKPDKKSLTQVNPRLARLITQKREQVKPKEVTKPQQQQKKPAVEKQEKINKSRRKAEKAGLMTMRSELASLQNMFSTQSLETSKPQYRSTSQATTSSTSADITRRASQGSGGIETSRLSNATANTALATRQRQQVSSELPELQVTDKKQDNNSARSLEDIQLVFLKNKNAISTIYNRALRKDPGLQGKIVLELSISASGEVLSCRVVSSELANQSLERKLLARIRSFKFPATKTGTVTVRYPLDFLPS